MKKGSIILGCKIRKEMGDILGKAEKDSGIQKKSMADWSKIRLVFLYLKIIMKYCYHLFKKKDK